MAHVADEIASQPDCWRARPPTVPPDRPARGPASGSRSSAAARRGSWRWRTRPCAKRAGHGETDAFQASEFPRRPRATTGSSRSPAPAPPPRCSTCSPRCATASPPPCSSATPRRRPRQAGRRGRGAAVRRRALGGADPLRDHRPRRCSGPHLGEDLAALAADAESPSRSPLPLDPAELEQVTFLGRGWTVGLAQEAALKCREAAGVLGRGVPGDGLPARPDLHRRARPAGLGLRRGARAGLAEATVAAHRRRPFVGGHWPTAGPDGRPDPGAAVRRGAGRQRGPGPRRAAPPDPVGACCA